MGRGDGPEAWHRFIEVFRLAARQAGEVARRLQAGVGLEEKPGQSSPQAAALTQVDLAAQDLLLLALAESFPSAAVDAEEDTETVSLFPPEAPGRPLLVLDPIDGTWNYARGSSEYAVMGAWSEGGRYRAAVVHFPEWRETFWAVEGEGAWRCRGHRGATEPVRVGTTPPRAAVTGAVPERWRQALAAAELEPARSHCSAVDALAPVLGWARAAVSVGRPSRRRAIGFRITAEAGGGVVWGGLPWTGQDPKGVEVGRRPTVAGASEEVARAIAETLLSADAQGEG